MSATPDNQTKKTITKRADGSLRISYNCKVAKGRPKTEQSHKGECDIKSIIRRYKLEGKPFPADNPENYRDMTVIPNFFEASLAVATAQSRFAALPSKVRERFDNDAGIFMEFISDPKKNGEEMVKLGLAKAVSSPPEAQKEEPATPPAKPPKKAPAPPKGGDGGQPEGGSGEAKDQ